MNWWDWIYRIVDNYLWIIMLLSNVKNFNYELLMLIVKVVYVYKYNVL